MLREQTLQSVAARTLGRSAMTDLPFPQKADFLSVREVAALFRINPKTVRRWIASGTLPATRLGRDWRIARSDLKALAAARGNRVQGHVL